MRRVTGERVNILMKEQSKEKKEKLQGKLSNENKWWKEKYGHWRKMEQERGEGKEAGS